MCVIVLAEKVRLLDHQVEHMWDANSKGGGIAWREEVDGVMKVKWEKGLTRAEMVEANQTLPFPYVLHFRLPSNGTSPSLLAAHPFQVDEHATTGFEGETDGYVLFHNGFWADWKNKMQQIALAGYKKVPSGPWSDSRGLAWAAYHLGLGYLDLIDEKVIIFGPQYIELFGMWITMAVTEGEDGNVLVTNKSWYRPTFPIHDHHQRTSDVLALAKQAITPKTEETGGSLHQGTFRTGVNGTQSEFDVQSDQSKSVQETAQGVKKEIRADTALSCAECHKVTCVGVSVNNGAFRCYQCHANFQAKPRVGLCADCKVSMAGCRTFHADRWICVTCWETNGRPRVYFGPKQEIA